MSEAERVRQFTEESLGQKCPERPVLMTLEQVMHAIKMVMDECDEMMSTVTSSQEEKQRCMQKCLDNRKPHERVASDYKTEEELIEAQADALVDINYYNYNTAAKSGFNLDGMFSVVHEANMNKRNPTTGKFEKRADGKILKPSGWTPPDTLSEIRRQIRDGSWN